ncbi:MAG TPA: ABC transporter permease [Candidatus Angelobacter sp.]
MRNLFQDIRYVWRTLGRSPGFTVVAVLTLALGIGANSTIFSWINSTLLNPLPGVWHTDGLVSLTRAGTEFSDLVFSYPDYVDLRDRNHSFSGLAAFKNCRVGLTGVGKPEQIWGMLASANYFDVLDVRPMLGRGFLPSEDEKIDGAPVVVIGYSLWQTHFGGSRSVIGQKININQHPYSIVGVAPPRFQGSQTALGSDFWIPMMMEKQIFSFDLLQSRSSAAMLLFGRLKPGVSFLQAQEETKLLVQQIADQHPNEWIGRSQAPTVEPMWRSSSGGNRVLYILLPMLMAIAGVVLLLACANVANLLLMRSVARRREIAIRLSLGASRWRLVRQHMVESMALALAGGGAAVLFTLWTAGVFTKFVPPSSLPIALSVSADRTVLFVTLVISILAAMVFGILPALRSSKLTPVTVLKEEAGSASGGLHKARLASGLVVAQLALSLLLLVCAGLFIRSFQNAQRFDPGFNPGHVLLSSYDLFGEGYSEADGIEFNRQLLAKVQALPGVQSASLADWVPLGLTWNGAGVAPEGYVPQRHENMTVASLEVSPGYFQTMQIPLVTGRDFTPGDTEKSERVVVVNQALADRYWPHQTALGKWIGISGVTSKAKVVGVARNSDFGTLNEIPQLAIYEAEFQHHVSFTTIHARVSGDPLAFAAAVEKAVHELNPDMPVFDVRTLQSQVEFASVTERIAGTFVGAFGVLALVLAAVGIYGVIAYTTRQRTREIGIRMAIGAQAGDIRRLILGQGLRLTAIGLGVGLAVSLALTRFLRTLVFGVTTTDAFTFVSVALLLCMVALAACYIPARRAMKVDPVIALRHE